MSNKSKLTRALVTALIGIAFALWLAWIGQQSGNDTVRLVVSGGIGALVGSLAWSWYFGATRDKWRNKR